jgi:hypothetical protein
LGDAQPFANYVAQQFLLNFCRDGTGRFRPTATFIPESEVPSETKERTAYGIIGELTIWVIKWGGAQGVTTD